MIFFSGCHTCVISENLGIDSTKSLFFRLITGLFAIVLIDIAGSNYELVSLGEGLKQ